MKHRYFLYFLMSLPLLQACKSGPPAASVTTAQAVEKMKVIQLSASTTRSVFFDELPSASGLEYVQGAFYVLGDDSPYLYQLNEKYELVQQYPLFNSTKMVNGRIPKAEKPDLESMAHLTYGRDDMLLLLGSGAAKARNKGYLVNLTDNLKVRELDLSRFYTFLKQVLRLESEGQLNLEGFAMDAVYTYLLQRPLGAGTNTLLRMETDEFKDFILREGEIPAVAVYHFELPHVGQIRSGFSGAFAMEGRLFFTASVEETPNAIEDGEILGSFIGLINLRTLPFASDAANPLQVPVVKLTNEDGSAYLGKAESLVVLKGEEADQYKVVVVSDDDKGHSELLEVQLEMR
ncbi:DUF6929 family protein [Pontibacter anaerobius]|uniref:DUF4397 domain-containing protein n=1 Tax=Pontibacter anaerobius TaxID=2993940 RepID=A0ABT3RCF8_9BACT|nr:hypothetical protein [Pontibacter anaerobius]MCX2739445.1 hypothetical protein [Pontibacter anaerobius]